ncbi:MAG: ABC transporter substrate-binding protein [Clostridiales bacterium]|nr:ABC transporter substrate-binding protein [Clostridiales bacterium]
MKKQKKITIALATLLCLALLSACGGGGSTGGGNNSTPPAGSTPESNAPIKVGILAPLTGDVAEYGIAVRNGAQLYIDQRNAAGGVNGKQIEVIQYDEEGLPTNALTGYNYLVDQGVTAIIGDVTTNPTLAVVPEAFADNMPMITASATAAAVTFDDTTGELLYPNMFRSCFIDPFQGEKMADFASANLDAKTAAVIFNTGIDYSIGLKDAFVKKAGEIGLEIVSQEGYADGAVDFQSQLTNIAARKPDVLFTPDYYNTVALISQQARNAGVTAAMLGGDGWATVLDVMNNPAPIDGSYYCSGYSVEDASPAVQDFLKAYMDEHGSIPNMFAAQGFDAAMVLVTALEIAETSGHATGSDEYRSAVIDAMRATDMECVTGHITYDAFNNPIKSAAIIHITGGVERFWGKY